MEYNNNEDLFYVEFRDVMYKLVNHGYLIADECPAGPPTPVPTPAKI